MNQDSLSADEYIKLRNETFASLLTEDDIGCIKAITQATIHCADTERPSQLTQITNTIYHVLSEPLRDWCIRQYYSEPQRQAGFNAIGFIRLCREYVQEHYPEDYAEWKL